jgi:hypothetical protein
LTVTLIDTWDWHYRVGFDLALAQRIRASISALPDRYGVILGHELEAYESFASVVQFLEAVRETPDAAAEFLDVAEEKRILPLAGHSKTTLEQLTVKLPVPDAVKQRIDKLLSRAIDAKYENPHRALFEPVFGCALDRLLTVVPGGRTLREPSPNEAMPARTRIAALLQEHQDFTYRHYRTTTCGINFTIEERPDDGSTFAEYWSAELLGEETDKLILYERTINSDIEEQDATLIHEVIGHGFFYNLARQIRPPYFDHGAIAYVEGWATAIEWQLSSPSYARHQIDLRLRALNLFDDSDKDAVCTRLSAIYSSAGLGEDQTRLAVRNYFQYPGLAYSYSLGGLWFRDYLEQAPLWLLAKQHPWGNFFRLF